MSSEPDRLSVPQRRALVATLLPFAVLRVRDEVAPPTLGMLLEALRGMTL